MLKTVMSATLGMAMLGSMQPLLANCVQPVTCTPDECEKQGDPVCTGDPTFNNLYYTIGQESTAYWPPGDGTGYIQMQPNTAKLNCLMNKYAPVKWQAGWSNYKMDAFAWTDAAKSSTVYTPTNSPPPGYAFPVAGVTNTGTHDTRIFLAGYNPYQGPWNYSNSPGGTVYSYTANWTRLQMELATAAHEAGHQLADGGSDENLYNGDGKAAVDNYDADRGSQCP